MLRTCIRASSYCGTRWIHQSQRGKRTPECPSRASYGPFARWIHQSQGGAGGAQSRAGHSRRFPRGKRTGRASAPLRAHPAQDRPSGRRSRASRTGSAMKANPALDRWSMRSFPASEYQEDIRFISVFADSVVESGHSAKRADAAQRCGAVSCSPFFTPPTPPTPALFDPTCFVPRASIFLAPVLA